MSKKIYLNDPFERNRIKIFIEKKWSELEQLGEQTRRQSAWNKDIDNEERRRRISYYFYSYLIFFMLLVSIFGIIVSLTGFALENTHFYAFTGILFLAILLMKTKKHGVKINISMRNFPIRTKSRKGQEKAKEKRMKKENERVIKEFLEGDR